MRFLFKRFCLICWHGTAMALVGLAMMLVLARVLLPLAGDLRNNFADLVGEFLGVPVHVESLKLSWQGYGPRLQIQGLTLLDPESGRAQARLQGGALRLGFSRPLWNLDYSIRELSLRGLPVLLNRDADGTLHVAGLGQPATSTEASFDPTRLNWLLGAERLSLLDTFIELREADGRVVRLSGIDLRIENDGQAHRLALAFGLPGSEDQPIRMLAEFQGSLDAIDAWKGRSFLELPRANLPALYQLLPSTGWPTLSGGAMSLKLWADWEGLTPVGFDAEVTLWDLRARIAEVEETLLRSVSVRMAGRREDGLWRTGSESLHLVDADGRPWATRHMQVDQLAAGAEGGTWRLALDQVDLADVGRFLGLFRGTSETLQWWQRLEPRGRLDNAWISASREGLQAAGARVQDLGVQAYRRVPAVSGVDGLLSWRDRALDVFLRSDGVRLEFDRLFRNPIDLVRLDGRVRLDTDPGGLHIASERLYATTEHILTSSRLDLRLPEDGPGVIDMQSHFHEGDGAQTSLYLPVGIMSPKLVQWLDQAVVNAQLVEGGMLIRGRLDEFPFAKNQGVFDVDFRIRDANLKYLPDWPAIEQLAARVRFNGPGLSIEADRAVTAGAELGPVRARIENLAWPRLEVTASSRADLADYLAFIRQSPLRSGIGTFFASATSEGEAPVELELTVPLFGVEPIRVAGHLELDGQSMTVEAFDLDLQAMRGSVRFTESSLSIDSARARIRGSEARVTAQTRDNGDRRSIRFGVTGEFTARQLLPRASLPIEDWFVGRAPWTLAINLPIRGPGQHSADIQAVGDLRGIEVRIPAPLAKPAGAAWPVRIESRVWPDARQDIRVSLQPGLRARVEFDPSRAQAPIRRAAITADDRVPVLPERGLSINGRFGEFTLDEWLAFAAAIPGEGGQPLWHRLSTSEVFLDSFRFGRLHLPNARFGLVARDDYLEVDVQAEHLVGRVEWPFDPGHQVVRGRLARFNLSEALDDADATGPDANDRLDPRRLPPLDFFVEELRWTDLRFANAELRSWPSVDGLNIEHLGFSDEAVRMEGRGSWRWYRRAPHEQWVERSTLDLRVSADDVGQALRSVGYADAIREGRGQVEARLGWYGALPEISLQRVRGHARIALDDGRLVSVDPGMGRIFGLLSLQALPRRLSLDFKDFLVDGFIFDRIRGDLAIGGGQARTDDLRMVGPAATIDVSGRVGLIARDYEQVVEVRPHLASSLPLVGALTGGPATGLAVFLVESVFSGIGLKVEDIGKVTYNLTGPWDQPKVEKVVKQPPEVDFPEFNQ